MSEMVIPTEYSQAEVDKMLRDKEREVKAILQEEDDALKKEIQEINAKLDDAKIHDLRQQEEIRKQRASLKAEQDSNRQLEKVNNGYLKSKEDAEHETYGVVRAGAKEMYRLMLEESKKLTEFASFVKDTVDPDCPELDLFIEEQKKFLVKIQNDPYLTETGPGGETNLFQIHRIDWDPETLFCEIHQAITEHQAGKHQPLPSPAQEPLSSAGQANEPGSSSSADTDPLKRVITKVREVFPDMAEAEVVEAILEAKKANNGKLSFQQVIEWITERSKSAGDYGSLPVCLICSQDLQEDDVKALQFKIPCCGQTFHAMCIHDWFEAGNPACPKCNK